ncbi:MAG: phage shock protein PspA [Alphaproteobacteria bacterium]|nr:MAG: phage shock protein PspA [Alphaproteobacteria bacterium]
MGIFSRLSDIINANLNALLDRAEDPEKMIRLMIQEMEDTLVEVRSDAARAIADQKDIRRRLERLERLEGEWQRKAELALAKGREDLARGALVEKAKVREMVEHLTHESEQLAEALARHEDDICKLEAKLREARAKKAALAARHKTAVNRLKVQRNLHDRRLDDAFQRFEQVERRIDRLEGEAEALEMGNAEGRTLEEEFRSLEVEETIEKELEALKKRLSGGKSDDTVKSRDGETEGKD